MKIEKLPSGSYRIRKQIDGHKVSLTFDHKPTKSEVLKALAEKSEEIVTKGSFEKCAISYIEAKSNVISPKTYKEYYHILNADISNDFKKLNIALITQQDIQLLINEFSSNHAPKTVRNIHGFISAVLKQFRPNMAIHTTLPQKRLYEPYIPSEEDIKRLLDASKDDHPNHIIFQLGIMGLRRSEILALTLDDIDGNILNINKAMVQNKDLEWVIKSTKTTAGTRKVYIPTNLVNEINELGYIYNRHPAQILASLNRYQKKLGLPHFRFHSLRHFFCSYAHANGISDADIMSTGGWRSDFTMRQVYRHEMKAKESQKKIFDSLI